MKTPTEHMQTSIDNWVEHGVPAPEEMGTFLRAILSHDFYAAIFFADDKNKAAIVEWAFFLYNEMPALAHGSTATLEAWYAHGGESGRHKRSGRCPLCGREIDLALERAEVA